MADSGPAKLIVVTIQRSQNGWVKVSRKARYENQELCTVLLVFGLRPTNPDSFHSYMVHSDHWCCFDKDDTALSLKEHFDIQQARFLPGTEVQQHATLELDGGIMVHAWAVRTPVSDRTYDVVQFWATQRFIGESQGGRERRGTRKK